MQTGFGKNQITCKSEMCGSLIIANTSDVGLKYASGLVVVEHQQKSADDWYRIRTRMVESEGLIEFLIQYRAYHDSNRWSCIRDALRDSFSIH